VQLFLPKVDTDTRSPFASEDEMLADQFQAFFQAEKTRLDTLPDNPNSD
jgi:hypothetical protein